jgi:Zn-finger nucleic acid-binding protein
MKLSDYNGTTPSDEGRARCPQCQEMLEIVDRATVVGYGCPGCGGIWLDSETTARVEQKLDTQTIQVGEVAASLAQTPFPPHAASPPCPLCEKPMRSHVVPGSDIEVDGCAAHGTWFDRGELQTLIRELMARADQPAPFDATISRNAPQSLISPEEQARMMAQYEAETAPHTPSDGALRPSTIAIGVGLDLLASLLAFNRPSSNIR